MVHHDPDQQAELWSNGRGKHRMIAISCFDKCVRMAAACVQPGIQLYIITQDGWCVEGEEIEAAITNGKNRSAR